MNRHNDVLYALTLLALCIGLVSLVTMLVVAAYLYPELMAYIGILAALSGLLHAATGAVCGK